jgi:4-aminobutyrate aminotransferase-like enzyme
MGEREDFLRELRVLARKNGLLLIVDTKHGKGSHYKVWAGDRWTVVPSSIGRFLRKGVLKDLGLD